MSESSGHTYLQSHDISGPVLTLDLAAESAAVLDAARAAGAGHSGRTLVREGPLRLLILGLKSGSTIRDHDAGGPLSLYVLSGHVEVAGGGRVESLHEGRALVFASNVTHSLEAKSDSVVLVTIAWPQA